ncbi:MAG: PPOX class F420-dependent oxidoreductase [Ilumatobacter sp.]
MSISDEKYVSITTFRKDGTPKPLPVWIADLGDGSIGFTTSSSSYKVKRIANDPRVTLQPSNSKGVVTEGSSEVSGTAEVVTGAEFERYAAILKKKYGIQYIAITFVGKVAKLFKKGTGTDCAVKITLD